VQVVLPTSRGRYKCVFTPQQEEELKSYCIELDNRCFGFTLKDLRRMAFDLANRNKLDHSFDCENRMAGTDWAYAFMKRSRLSLRRPSLLA
jgi:hypothetical protein